jgi:DNA replication and repair protein RecF
VTRPGTIAVDRVALRDFRTYARAEVTLGAGLTVITGRNGAGKTNLLEALYFGCTGRSCRTSNEREVVRFGSQLARVEVGVRAPDGPHRIAVGFSPGEAKHLQVDGSPVERLLDNAARPLVSVFLPDRLELVKGTPALRRAHLDQLIAAMWPARAATRRAYGQALAQRNALLGRVRAGMAGPGSLDSWELEMARLGVEVMADRGKAVTLLEPLFEEIAGDLGLDGEVGVRYRPRSGAGTAEELATELRDRREQDLARGFSGHGPHRDELVLSRDGRELRAYGSQGQQRLALLALLLAERRALADQRDATPLLLLDDVLSELDADRRARLLELVSGEGQTVITTTELEHLPASAAGAERVAVADGVVVSEATAA